MGCGCGGGKAPKQPDYAAAAVEGQNAAQEVYPMEYLINQASTLGDKITIDGKTYDFTGLGQADLAKSMSDKMAQVLLDIQKNHGSEYVQQRLKELKAADPEGYAARQQLFDRIMAQANEQPDRPIADDLQQQIMGQLQQAGKMDRRMEQQVEEGVRGKQVEGGLYLGNAAASDEASAKLQAGDDLQASRQQQGVQFLQSGVSPEDVEYRRIQQNLANLSSFNNGQTPTAQFGQLSGAQQGIVPFQGGGAPQTRIDPNAQQRGANNALSIYSTNQNWANQQANPFTAGISMGINGYNAYQAWQKPGGNGATVPQSSYGDW